jgi:hypothetical protein
MHRVSLQIMLGRYRHVQLAVGKSSSEVGQCESSVYDHYARKCTSGIFESRLHARDA